MEEDGGAEGLVSLPADKVARMEKLVRKYGIVPPNAPSEDEQEVGEGAVEALDALLTEMRGFHKLASMMGYRDWAREGGRGPAQYCLDKVLSDGGPRLLRVHHRQKAQTGQGPLSHKLRGHLEVFLVEGKWCGDKAASTWIDRAMQVIQDVLTPLGLGGYQLKSYRDVEAFCLTYRDELYDTAYDKDYPQGKAAKKGTGINEKFLQPYHGLYCWATGADHKGLEHLPVEVRQDALAKRKANSNTKATATQDRASTGKARTVSVKRTSKGKAKATTHDRSESSSGSESSGSAVSPHPKKFKARPPQVSHIDTDDYTDSDIDTRPPPGLPPSDVDLMHDTSRDMSMDGSKDSTLLDPQECLSRSLRTSLRIDLRLRGVGQDAMERGQMMHVLADLVHSVAHTAGEGHVVLSDGQALLGFLTTHLNPLKALAWEGDRAAAPVVSTRVAVLSEALAYVGQRDASLPPPTNPRANLTVTAPPLLTHVKHEHN